MRRKVFVTGMGCVTSVGNGCESLYDALYNGKTGISESLYFNELAADIKVAAEIQQPITIDLQNNHEISHRIKMVTRKKALLPMESSIASIFEALTMAGVPQINLKNLAGKTGIIVAGNNLSQQTQYLTFNRYKESIDFITPKYALEFFDTNYIGVLSEIFGIDSEGMSVGGASASGNVGLLQAHRMVAHGILDSCVVVSPVVDFSSYELHAFNNLGVFGNHYNDFPKQACRPFDKNHEGFVLGQGAGAVLLESDESVHTRKVECLGEILGGAIKLDGNHLSDTNTKGEQSCMKLALEDAQVSASAIEYVNAHGTSTPLGDKMEAIAISNVFKYSNPWVNSSKSMIGHCMYSAGLLEVIISLIQMKNNFIHPNLNLDNPLEECANISLVGKNSIDTTIGIAMSNSFGFGGINSSVILKNV